MKTKKHKLQDGLLLVLFLAALGAIGWGLYHFFGQASEGAVEAAVPDDADAVFYVDFRAMNQSAFGRAMAEEATGDPFSGDIPGFLEPLGLTGDDLVEGLVAIRDLSALQNERFSQAGLSAALRLAVPVSLEQIETALREGLEEEGLEADAGDIRRTTLGDRDVLEFALPDMNVTFQLTVFEREDGNATLYFGEMNALRDTIAKLESRREKTLPSEIRAGKDSMTPDSHAWLVLLVSPPMQSGLREMIDASPLPLGPAGQALGSLHRTGLSLRANESLSVQMAMAFGSPDDAQTVRGFLNENILPMANMMAEAQEEDMPGFLGDLRADAREDTVSLTATISIEDIRRMSEAAMAQVAPPPEPETAPTPAQPSPTTPDTQAEPEPDPPSWPVLHVQTVLTSTNEAVINGELLAVGDEFEGVTLQQVAEDGVVFGLDREFRFVGVGESTEEDP